MIEDDMIEDISQYTITQKQTLLNLNSKALNIHLLLVTRLGDGKILLSNNDAAKDTNFNVTIKLIMLLFRTKINENTILEFT